MMISRFTLLFALSVAAHGSMLTYSYTIGGTLPDGPVSAEALLTLDMSAHTLDIALTNLLVNPVSDGQLVSSLFIGGLAGAPVLASSVANQGNPPGSTVSPRPGGTGWGFGGVAGGYALCIICPGSLPAPGKTAPPSLLIIGPPDSGGQYSNANSSIFTHSPYLFEEALFRLTGVTNAPSNENTIPFSSLRIGFGSEAIELTAGSPGVRGSASTEVPEPHTWLLSAAGFVLTALGRRQIERTRRVRALAGR